MAIAGTADQVGGIDVRAQFFDKAVKQVASENYVMKQAVAVVPTNAWINFFWREGTSVLAGATGNTTKGIPRGAEFPSASAEWTRVSTNLVKYGLEDNITWEDLKTDEIGVQTRTAIKLGAGVADAVDDAIYDGLTEGGRTKMKNIQSLAIADPKFWNGASAAILDNLFEAARLIKNENYPTTDLICFVSPRDKRSIMKWLSDKGAQFPSIAEGVSLNGEIGKLAGIRLVESKALDASSALVVVPKRCATWKETQPLTTVTKEDPYKSITIRCVEMGTLQLTDPKAVVWMYGTEGADPG